MIKLSELLAQDSVTLEDGHYLAAHTVEAGYVPTHKDTFDFHFGKYLYKVEGTDNGVKIVKVVNKEDQSGYEEMSDYPVVELNGDKLHYTTGRNNKPFKDSYHDKSYHTVDVVEGEGHRQALIAFLEFSTGEYSMGVNDYVMIPATNESLDEVPEPEPEPEEPEDDGEEGNEGGEE